MPANLPPNYHRAEQRYREAIAPEDKVEALEEMLRIMPKHKGTDHLQADLRKRLSQHKKEVQQSGKKSARTSSPLDHIEKEGAGQVLLLGLPNSGKTSLVAKSTNAPVEPADYPFSTFKPATGMMAFEDVQIQLVDLPPVSSEHTEPWVFNLIRNADLILLTIDLSQPAPEDQVLEITALLEERRLMLSGDPEALSPDLSTAVKHTVVLATKTDHPNAQEGFNSLSEAYGDEFAVYPLSVHSGNNLADLPGKLFHTLGMLRIYTKAPGKKPDMGQPYVLPIGSTVHDVAEAIHRDLADNLRFARIWGSEKYDGQQVKQDHVVEDKDVIEIHV